MSAAPILRPRTKAIVYATSGRRLLIFRQPDYPDVGWQPPGGTVDAGEAIDDAARREFEEETGLPAKGAFTPLGACTYRYVANGFDHIHERHFFHLALDGAYPETFETIEATPEEGGPPIRFAFIWRSLDDPALALHAHLDALLPELRRRLAEGGRMSERVAVAGAGAFGTALALVALRAGRDVTLLARDAAQAEQIGHSRENPRYLPGATLPPEIAVTADPNAFREAELVFLPCRRRRRAARSTR